MLKFYMDESGLGKNVDERVCGIAGFVTQNSSWKGFHKQWQHLLREYELDEFKSKELGTHIGRQPCGKYVDWAFGDANEFMSKALRLLFSYKPSLLCGSVQMYDFHTRLPSVAFLQVEDLT